MTKEIIVERNVIIPHHFKIDRQIKIVDDPGIRMTPARQIGRKQVELAKIWRKREQIFKLIQYNQLLALKTDDDIEARQAQEYVEMILIPQMHGLERDMMAIKIQIDKLKARL